jgi:hypothetical protein
VDVLIESSSLHPLCLHRPEYFSGDSHFQGTDYIDDFLRKSLCFTNIYDNATDRILYSINQKAKYITYKRISQGRALPLHLTTKTDHISKVLSQKSQSDRKCKMYLASAPYPPRLQGHKIEALYINHEVPRRVIPHNAHLFFLRENKLKEECRKLSILH